MVPGRVKITSTREFGCTSPATPVESVIGTETARNPGSMVEETPSTLVAAESLESSTGSFELTGTNSTRPSAPPVWKITPLGTSFSG